MKELILEIKRFSKQELYNIEKHDLQYQSLAWLWKNLKDIEIFTKLIIFNALLSYQLSTSWEKYREKFSNFCKNTENYEIKEKIKKFIEKYNKRLLQMRLKRLEKISPFIEKIDRKSIEIWSKDQHKLLEELSFITKQKKDAKTIVFALKIFVWWMRISWKNIEFASDIFIPIDSRIWKISENKDFWTEISIQTKMPLLLIDNLLYLGMSDKIQDIGNKETKDKLLKLRDFLDRKYIN